MRWFKKHLRNVGMASVSILFLLTCLALIPLSAVSAHAGTPGVATPTTVAVQLTPTVDATVTVLQKEQLEQEVLQLKEQNAPDLLGWLRANAAILLSTLVVVIGGLVGLFRWLGDRRSEREKRAEERFQAVVTGLGDDKEGARIGAAILLRTFLRPGYEQFYTQTFDLAVAHLRLPRIAHQSDDPDGLSHPSETPTAPLPLTTLSQALIVVFKEAFPLARNLERRNPQSLDGTGVLLDKAYISKADLKQAWMPHASMREANLSETNLSKANLGGAKLSRANLSETNLSKANLGGAKLSRANLFEANLSEADLHGADFSYARLIQAKLSRANLSRTELIQATLHGANLNGADLTHADLSEANLSNVDLRGAKLREAKLREAKLRGADLSGVDLHYINLSGVDLSRANLSSAVLTEVDLNGADLSRANLSGANLRQVRVWVEDGHEEIHLVHIEAALSLEKTNLRGIKGLTKEQLAACKAKGAIIDEEPTTSASQSTVAHASPPQSNGTQVPSAPPAQESTPPPDPDGSNTASSQPDPKS